MLLCPLLQTLGLETEARDNFLSFIEKTIFIAVSADANSVDGATGNTDTEKVLVIFLTVVELIYTICIYGKKIVI